MFNHVSFHILVSFLAHCHTSFTLILRSPFISSCSLSVPFMFFHAHSTLYTLASQYAMTINISLGVTTLNNFRDVFTRFLCSGIEGNIVLKCLKTVSYGRDEHFLFAVYNVFIDCDAQLGLNISRLFSPVCILPWTMWYIYMEKGRPFCKLLEVLFIGLRYADLRIEGKKIFHITGKPYLIYLRRFINLEHRVCVCVNPGSVNLTKKNWKKTKNTFYKQK